MTTREYYDAYVELGCNLERFCWVYALTVGRAEDIINLYN